jgi:hypothetical protein
MEIATHFVTKLAHCVLNSRALNAIVFARDVNASPNCAFSASTVSVSALYWSPRKTTPGKKVGAFVFSLVISVAALSLLQLMPQRAIVRQPRRQILLSSRLAFASGIASCDDTAPPTIVFVVVSFKHQISLVVSPLIIGDTGQGSRGADHSCERSKFSGGKQPEGLFSVSGTRC